MRSYLITIKDSASFKEGALPEEGILRTHSNTNWYNRMYKWMELQECKQPFWVKIELLISLGCMFPLAAFAIVTAGENNIAFWMLAVSANVPLWVAMLAAKPPKYTLPLMFAAAIIESIVILTCVVLFIAK
jgi:hypothetical protein